MRDIIVSDLYRYGGSKFLIKSLIFGAPGFRFTYFLRKANIYKKNQLLGLFYILMHRIYMYKYGFQIPVGTKIGKGFYIGHFGTLVINGKAEIGDNCNVAHNVTIGQENRGKRKGFPVIGNKVWIGTGSVIVGKIKIGNNVLIAPNSYVNTDVPSNLIAIGNPLKIVKKDNAIEGYIEHIL